MFIIVRKYFSINMFVSAFAIISAAFYKIVILPVIEIASNNDCN